MGKKMPVLEEALAQRLSRLPDSAARVIRALADDRFDFRTVRGLSEATEIPEELVQQVVEEHGELVRISGASGPRGERLYALRSRPVTARESLAIAQVAVEKSVS